MNAKPSMIVTLCLALLGCASSPSDPDDQFRNADKTSRFVLAEGEGATVEKARESAIRNAIDKVAGSLVLSDQAISGGKVIRNDVSTHRAAYVTDTEIVETTQPGSNRYRVKLWAKVNGSQLYSRAIPIPAGTKALDGTAIAEQLKAALAFKEEGDRLLKKAMEVYPIHAFQVIVENAAIALDEYRNSSLRIRMRVEWRPLYTEALREAVNVLANDRSQCNLLTAALMQPQNEWDRQAPVDKYGNPLPVTGLCGAYADLVIVRREPGKLLPQVYGYSLGDLPRISMIGKKLSAPLSLQLSLVSENGRDADVFCESISNHPLIDARMGIYGRRDRPHPDSVGRIEIRQHETWMLEWPLIITNLDKFKKIKRIAAKIVASC